MFSYKRLRRFGLTLAATALGTAALTSPALAHAQHYHYTTLNNNGDSTFNQLLGINNSGASSLAEPRSSLTAALFGYRHPPNAPGVPPRPRMSAATSLRPGAPEKLA